MSTDNLRALARASTDDENGQPQWLTATEMDSALHRARTKLGLKRYVMCLGYASIPKGRSELHTIVTEPSPSLTIVISTP